MNETQQLLTSYVKTGSEQAFRELVDRYVGLVYSAAIRLVNGDSHMAEDISQTVFADLARTASRLSEETMLGGWLHRHTCFVAANHIRSERRRQQREKAAMEINATADHSAENLARLTPVLDEAVNELGSDDRTAILLRYFEQNDFRTIGQTLGSNEEAARKRVDRALDKLHGVLLRRGVALSGAALSSMLLNQAVVAAPAGLSGAISASALAGASTAGTAVTLLKLMATTKVKVMAITAVLATGVAIPVLNQQREKANLAAETAALRQEIAALSQAVAQAKVTAPSATPQRAAAETGTNAQFRELLRLRGEVGRLRMENAAMNAIAKTNATNPLNNLLADPAMRRTFQEQQKMALKQVYKDLTNRIALAPAQNEKLVELLSESMLQNVDTAAAMLREGKTVADAEPIFAERESALRASLQALLGPEGLAEYDDFTRNLTTRFTVLEFSDMLSGSDAERTEKSRQLFDSIQQETLSVLAAAGLASDYQTLPRLNFRNLASEEEAERSLQLLNTIYSQTATRAAAFLTTAELNKFAEFRTNAIYANRLTLLTARKVMTTGN